MEERKSVLVKLGEDSDLKVDLNLGVISLLVAKESYFQPHICLNEKSGVEVIKKISQNSEKANTEIWINEFAILSFDDIWLNIKFCVSLNEISFPNNMVYLTPRQTGYIVRNLKPESKVIVLEKIKRWYFEEFLVKTKKVLTPYQNSLMKVTLLLRVTMKIGFLIYTVIVKWKFLIQNGQ